MQPQRDANKTFSLNIKRLRESRGWSQAELARKAELTSASVNQLEKGKRNPSVNVSSKIAQALDTKVAELFADAEKSNVQPAYIDFYERFRVIEKLSEEDQQTILNLARRMASDN